MPAFQRAIDAGFQSLECDVWETRPDTTSEETSATPTFMLMHDQNLLRMCGVPGLIDTLSPPELADIRVVNGNGSAAYPEGLAIPALGEFLDLFVGNNLVPILDIKPGTTNPALALSEAGAKELLHQLDERGLGDRAFLQSFNMTTLRRLRSAKETDYPDMKLKLFYISNDPSAVSINNISLFKNEGLTGFCLNRSMVTSALVKAIHAEGLMVGVYTVDDTTRACQLALVDRVDFIVTNEKIFR
jgi:glycerophosphoryl diester phosphodiesterase